MSWTPEIEAGFINVRTNAQPQVELYGRDIINRIPAAVQNIQGAQGDIDTNKQRITNIVENVSRKTQELKDIVKSLNEAVAADRRNIEITKDQVKELNETVGKEKTLNMIRKEQAESLTRRWDGNYHSSWMGLFRPLKEDSRFGLIIAAVAFALIGISAIVYAYVKGLAGSLMNKVQVPDSFNTFGQKIGSTFN